MKLLRLAMTIALWAICLTSATAQSYSIEPGKSLTVGDLTIHNTGDKGNIRLDHKEKKDKNSSSNKVTFEKGANGSISGLSGCGDTVTLKGDTKAVLQGNGFKVDVKGDRGAHTISGNNNRMDMHSGSENNNIDWNGNGGKFNNNRGKNNVVTISGDNNTASVDGSGNKVVHKEGQNNTTQDDPVDTSCP